MKTGRGIWGGLALVLCALGVMVAAAPAAASVPIHVQQTDADCRCVDANGDAIADCTCLRTPRFERMLPPIPPMAPMAMRPRLGISVSTEQGSELDARGARVTNVLEDGPAWNAGLREGDVITSIDGQSLFTSLQGDAEDDFDLDASIPVQRLLAIARELEPGQEVDVEFLREDERRSVTVEAEDLSDRSFAAGVPFDMSRLREQMRGFENLRDLDRVREFQQFEWQPGEPGAFDFEIFDAGPGTMFFGSSSGRYGLQLVPLNEGLGQYFGVAEGVLVVGVTEDSALGLEAGDVILSIGGRETTTPDRVMRVFGSYTGDEDIPLRVRRNGREIEVMGRLER
jgi:hypothetical protein